MLEIGTKTEHGEIVGMMWIGERYYMTLKDGVVGLFPATSLEG